MSDSIFFWTEVSPHWPRPRVDSLPVTYADDPCVSRLRAGLPVAGDKASTEKYRGDVIRKSRGYSFKVWFRRSLGFKMAAIGTVPKEFSVRLESIE